MEFEAIYAQVGEHALLSKRKAAELYEFILSNKPETIFEIGFYKGGSTIIMAAALEQLGRGRIKTFDVEKARRLAPSLADLAERTGLRPFIEGKYCDWCAEWELAKILRDNVREGVYHPFIDFAFIDTRHAWTDTGYNFYLLSKLLRPGGWVLFDDLTWTCNKWLDWTDLPPERKEWVMEYPPDARDTPMVSMVFDLLVRTDPTFGNFTLTCDDDWGWAQKLD